MGVAINRPINTEEIVVVQTTLSRAPASPEIAVPANTVAQLQVVGRCSCGCDTVDFAAHDPANRASVIADAIGTTPAGGRVGVLVWGYRDAVTGLEVYDLGAGESDIKLPVPDSIQPWERAAV